jgi:hypothetical protein
LVDGRYNLLIFFSLASDFVELANLDVTANLVMRAGIQDH